MATTVAEHAAHRAHPAPAFGAGRLGPLPHPDCTPCAEESAAIGHLRGYCHNSLACPICQAENRAHAAEQQFRSVMLGH